MGGSVIASGQSERRSINNLFFSYNALFILGRDFEAHLKLFAKKIHKKPFDTASNWGRFLTVLHYLWADHAYLRLGFSNAFWIDDKLLRANQPWPFQLRWWKKAGLRSVVTLRGGKGSFYFLEKWGCERDGLTFHEFGLTSRSLPTAKEIAAAKTLFDTIEYPCLIHCKSGADRAGMMSVLYRHLHLGHPIEEAKQELSFKYLHASIGHTGVLDHLFDHYLREIQPTGLSFWDWTQGDSYDPDALKARFKAGFWGKVLTDIVLRRE
jgi:protein tyrosine/serine phosphatase